MILIVSVEEIRTRWNAAAVTDQFVWIWGLTVIAGVVCQDKIV
jgi:hypothetical protein